MINWDIKHKALKDTNGEYFYLCNQAVIPNFMKVRMTWRGVNCKNCLKQHKVIRNDARGNY